MKALKINSRPVKFQGSFYYETDSPYQVGDKNLILAFFFAKL